MSREPSVFTPALASPAEVDLRDVATADSLLVALDFDGVLAPLQDDPETSRMVPDSAAAIAELVRLPRTRVALVSGRDIATLRRLAHPPEGVWMIGSHGAEADLGPDAEVNHSPGLTAAEEEMLAAIDAHIEAFAHALPEDAAASDAGDGGAAPSGVGRMPGVRVEEKPYSRTVHTRGFDPQEAASLHAHATKVAEEFPAIRVIEGHDITELAVKQATKGDGLRLLAGAGQPTAMAYLGDDVTDEDAFTALDELTARGEFTAGDESTTASSGPAVGSGLTAGLTVKVGAAETRADWRIADPAAVAALLGRLAGERSDHLGAGRP